MKAKLTLSIDADVIKMAKTTSEKKKQSLSYVVENFLRESYSSKKKEVEKQTITERIRALYTPPKKQYTDAQLKKMRDKDLKKKYGF